MATSVILLGLIVAAVAVSIFHTGKRPQSPDDIRRAEERRVIESATWGW